ncbi:MBL fold metallo-hydrolase [Clostridium magnum]|uniref:Hydroxyacylglutathione hydrolase n=1 Tax=Clostridium magnum DSM 2767 TaxID=1121326 RepID=A0A162R0M7_9CLOT|nr:MBL fold metallo-hydrolase [Clostridium magnum]KZL89244.1 hydroxyacylglutathione hydrolase [Clostridium magnum DSM 2767]SHJ55537.1 Glyoxylase, beta-lactamase superfamily II [Clostridium magnum DSM 2767]
MEKITQNVYTNTKIRGCNPSIVFTSEGAVFIDNAQWISTLLEMIDFAKSKGPIKYLINTEPHIDHIFGNHWFAGVCPVVGHEKVKDTFFLVPGEMDGYDYSVDVITRQDKESLPLMPSREEYVVNMPQITFNDKMSLKVGDHTFNLYHTPGHADSQIAVHVPEERVVFVGDTIFSDCQTWLHSANIDDLINSLHFLKTLDVDYIVPGHGPVVTKAYIDVQLAVIYKWIGAVADGISKGWSQDECIKNIKFEELPVDIGQDEMMEYIQTTNVIKCYNYVMNKNK